MAYGSDEEDDDEDDEDDDNDMLTWWLFLGDDIEGDEAIDECAEPLTTRAGC